MIRFFRGAVLALMLIPSAGTAQDFDAGLAAAQAGDFATALREWTPLAEQGYAGAQTNLGVMYAEGQGVPQDDAEAVKWFRLAAGQGNADSQNSLGNMYIQGQGVPQDFGTAHMWFNLSAANGNTAAVEARDSVGSQLSPADLAEAQRRARVCLASNYQNCD